MLDTYKYTVASLFRNAGILVWALAFPIVLSSCFLFMFGSLDELNELDPIETIVVTSDAYEDSPAFKKFIETVDGSTADSDSSEAMLNVTYVGSKTEAENLLTSGDSQYAAFITVPSEEAPVVNVGATTSATYEKYMSAILVRMMDMFVSRADLVKSLIADDSAALSNSEAMQSIFEVPLSTIKTELTANAPKESVRYYFALLGMAALFGAQVGLTAVIGLLPNMGPLGARRAISGVSHAKALAGTLLAAWTVSMLCLIIAYLYMRFVCNIDFAGRDASCVLALAVSSLMATSLGAAIAVIPKMNFGAKTGVLTAITCFGALFAGLYGEPTMELADMVAKAAPWSTFINPAVQVSDAFYALTYYDTLMPCIEHLGILLLMAVILFVLSANALRRQRYASL